MNKCVCIWTSFNRHILYQILGLYTHFEFPLSMFSLHIIQDKP